MLRTYSWRVLLLLLAFWAGCLFVPLTPAGRARGAAAAQAKGPDDKARKEAQQRLKRVANAFWDYYDDYGEFPPAALVRKDGKALLSWRVLLLPYLGEEKLFRAFKLTEPWDSAHNRKLLARMPKVFAPVDGTPAEPHATLWQVFTGPGTLFEGTAACQIYDIADGTSNTLLVVEGALPVPWTSPRDLPYDPRGPLPKLGRMFPGLFLFSTADGAVYRGRRDFDARTLRLTITRDDGMALNLDGILAKEQP
jgi:hypothetical protein